MSKRGLLRLSKKDLGDILYNPERKRGVLRLSKKDSGRDTIPHIPKLLHLQQRSLRLTKRGNSDSLRLSKKSVTDGLTKDHKMVIRLSKRQLANLVALKRDHSSRR